MLSIDIAKKGGVLIMTRYDGSDYEDEEKSSVGGYTKPNNGGFSKEELQDYPYARDEEDMCAWCLKGGVLIMTRYDGSDYEDEEKSRVDDYTKPNNEGFSEDYFHGYPYEIQGDKDMCTWC